MLGGFYDGRVEVIQFAPSHFSSAPIRCRAFPLLPLPHTVNSQSCIHGYEYRNRLTRWHREQTNDGLLHSNLLQHCRSLSSMLSRGS